MANRWTPEQQEAINIENTNVIVSAGAGSGKTAVLSERVLRKIKDGTSINRLLILTFTKAAAKEMKERIRKKLKDEKYDEQVKLIDSSYITTFDSYSLSIVKKYYTYLHVDKNIKITDEALIDIRKKDILDKILDNKYKEGSESFSNLIYNFALKDDKDLKRLILTINKKLDLKYDKKEYLENYEKTYYSEEQINKTIEEFLNILENKVLQIKDLKQSLESNLEGKTLEKFRIEFSKMEEDFSYDNTLNFLNNFSMPRKTKDYTEEMTSIKDEIKSLIDDLKKLCIYEKIEDMKQSILNSRENTLEIVDILLKLHNEFEIVKQKEGLYDFNDISHLAIKLVKENETIREEIKNSFDEILIDEYQDTNDIQELFISQIQNNNVYMVGDIKQSIYRFRNANPYLFKTKYDNYSKNIGGKKIDLIKNFRSRDEVLNNINLIFNYIMDDDIGGANYIQDHQMVFGNMTYKNEGNTNQDYNMKVLTYEQDDTFKNIVKEAFIIASDIKNKIENKYQIFDKDKKILRNAEYSDFVILLDVKKNFTLYKQIFEYLNIPLLMYSDTDLTLSDDLFVLKNLIKLILLVHDNNYTEEFKYNYVSLARSFLFNYSDNDIFTTCINNNFKEDEIINKCKKISTTIDYLPLTQIFENILEEFNYLEKILTTKNIIDKEKRVEYITNLLNDLSDKNYNLYDLSYYLEQVIELGYNIKYKPYQSSVNSVKIMSIHTSKGLEFPICYLAGTENKFNTRDITEKISFDNNYGILLPEISEEVLPTIRTMLYKIKARREDISERIRLLYVLVTRAKEQFIIVMPEKEKETYLENKVSIVKRDKYISFNSILESIKPLLSEYTEKQENIKYTDEYLYQSNIKELEKDTEEKITLEEISFDNNQIEETHYSKNSINLKDKETRKVMDIGTEVHQILEEIDFNKPNLDELVPDKFIRNKIDKFIQSDIIKNNLNSTFYKEYEFIFTKENEIKRGIIDLLIENDKEMIIIDYKLNNVLDEAYTKQLNGYKEYISTITTKPIKVYLYSIIGEKFEEVI